VFKMRAIQVASFGGPEVLTLVELPDPVAGPGQVVVGMAAADVIFLDTLLRSGRGQDFFPRTLPYVPGGGGSGAVVQTGEGVDPAWIGRRVVVQTSAGGGGERLLALSEVAFALYTGDAAVGCEDLGDVRLACR
jgi:NADPH2:quinone reductase